MATHGYTWHYMAIHGNIMVIHGNTLQHIATHDNTNHYMAVCSYSILFFFLQKLRDL